MKHLLVIVALTLAGCCSAQRAVVDVTRGGIDAAGEIAGDSDEMRQARDVLAFGDAMAEQCTDADGWQRWVAIALQAVDMLIGVFSSRDLDAQGEAPPELLQARDRLAEESAQ